MSNTVYNFKLNIDWKLINLISEIDRFDANWTAIERKEGQSLKELKNIATVRSVGASNRIEGNKMSDEEIEVLLQKLDITKLTDRDSQEVVGYFEVLDLISDSYETGRTVSYAGFGITIIGIILGLFMQRRKNNQS